MVGRIRFFLERKHLQQSAVPRRLSLHLEQLEPRMLMNADNNPAPLADVGTDLLVQPMAALSVAVPRIAFDDVAYIPYSFTSPLPAAPESGFASVDDLRAWVIDSIDTRFGHLFGTSPHDRNVHRWARNRIFGIDSTNTLRIQSVFGLLANDRSFSLASHSPTNVQVEGVDEADLLETDGQYLYLVTGNELVIVDVSDAEDLAIVSRVQLDDRPTGMYLSGDRLTLISTTQSTYSGHLLSWGGSAQPHNAKVSVSVLDLTDRAAPTQVQRTELPGNLVSSRMVSGQLRIVLSQQAPNLTQPKIKYELNQSSGQTEGTYESRDEYLDRVLDDTVNSLLATYRTLGVEAEVLSESSLVQPEEIRGNVASKLVIATFDVNGSEAGPADVMTLATTGASEVYATQDSLYVFGRPKNSYYGETTIWKFGFDPDDHSVTLEAKGKVSGTLLNQFSADEHDGFLRVVTKPTSWSAGSNLFVLQQRGAQLQVVGSVEDLAPGENLHSVRFTGEQAFVVTFEKVDPLFAIDLSDPTNPTVAGELKIPGYSDYLQPIGENYLLGIGRDAPVEGGLFQEMQISIFDVSDLSDPQLAHRFSLDGGRSTASIATGGRWTQGDGDHHAVSYFPSEQILALPIHSETSWRSSSPRFAQAEGGLNVFSIDTETGIESLAILEHDTPILRSLRIGEALFAVSSGEITSHDISNSVNQLASLPLLIGSDVGLVELTTYQTPPAAAIAQSAALAIATTSPRGFERVDSTHRLPEAELRLEGLKPAPLAYLSLSSQSSEIARTVDDAFSTIEFSDADQISIDLEASALGELVFDSLG